MYVWCVASSRENTCVGRVRWLPRFAYSREKRDESKKSAMAAVAAFVAHHADRQFVRVVYVHYSNIHPRLLLGNAVGSLTDCSDGAPAGSLCRTSRTFCVQRVSVSKRKSNRV
jgi:hypothetical protein